jgi:hypothetical protein
MVRKVKKGIVSPDMIEAISKIKAPTMFFGEKRFGEEVSISLMLSELDFP